LKKHLYPLADLNRQVLEWCNEEANARIHGTTHAVPWERLRDEQEHLKALPAVPGITLVPGLCGLPDLQGK
jgi:hypothetical protein